MDNQEKSQHRNPKFIAKTTEELVEFGCQLFDELAFRIAEEQRIALAGCIHSPGFTVGYCATCGRDEREMSECPYHRREK